MCNYNYSYVCLLLLYIVKCLSVLQVIKNIISSVKRHFDSGVNLRRSVLLPCFLFPHLPEDITHLLSHTGTTHLYNISTAIRLL